MMYKATVSQENVFFISDKIVGDDTKEIKEIVEEMFRELPPKIVIEKVDE